MIIDRASLLSLMVWGVILLLPILPNLWSIWHIFKNDFPTPQEKMTWVLIATFLPVIGGILYVFWGRKKVIKGEGVR